MTYLPVTVYIDDINDHKPVFTSAPYNITVLATDKGKPSRSASAIINLTLRGGSGPAETPRSSIERVKNPLIISPFDTNSANDLTTNTRQKIDPKEAGDHED